jgi:tRNA-Thr(GGU) m(6)t(6)A37 methyltransferase TsaA
MTTEENASPPPPASVTDDYAVKPIGHVDSALRDRGSAPRQSDEGAPPATLVLDASLEPALRDLRPGADIVVLTWLHQAPRDELLVHPRGDVNAPLQGVFSTRSPGRPNPIGLHTTTVVAVDGTRIAVESLEAIDGTPILDIKPILEPPGQR